jgi:hypothetical protein
LLLSQRQSGFAERAERDSLPGAETASASADHGIAAKTSRSDTLIPHSKELKPTLSKMQFACHSQIPEIQPHMKQQAVSSRNIFQLAKHTTRRNFTGF